MCKHVITFITVSFLYQVPSARHLKRGQSGEGSPSSPCVACSAWGPLPPGRVAGLWGTQRGAGGSGLGEVRVSRAVLHSLGPLQGRPPSRLARVELCPSLPQGLARPGCVPALADPLGAEQHLAALLASWVWAAASGPSTALRSLLCGRPGSFPLSEEERELSSQFPGISAVSRNPHLHLVPAEGGKWGVRPICRGDIHPLVRLGQSWWGLCSQHN